MCALVLVYIVVREIRVRIIRHDISEIQLVVRARGLVLA